MKNKFSDYYILDIILKAWFVLLVTMFVLGMSLVLYTLFTNPSAINNATFGIFDTLG